MAITIQQKYEHYAVNDIIDFHQRELVKLFCNKMEENGFDFGPIGKLTPNIIFNSDSNRCFRVLNNHNTKRISQNSSQYIIHESFNNYSIQIIFTFDEWITYEKEVNSIDLNYTPIKIEYTEIEW